MFPKLTPRQTQAPPILRSIVAQVILVVVGFLPFEQKGIPLPPFSVFYGHMAPIQNKYLCLSTGATAQFYARDVFSMPSLLLLLLYYYSHFQVHIFYFWCLLKMCTCCNVKNIHYFPHIVHCCSTIHSVCMHVSLRPTFLKNPVSSVSSGLTGLSSHCQTTDKLRTLLREVLMACLKAQSVGVIIIKDM